ncbi:MAG: regulator [Rhodoglobus sp.]
MATRVLGVPGEVDGQLRGEAVRHGHEVLASGASAQHLEAMVRALRPGAAVVRASPQFLTARVVAACDDAGVSVIALVATEIERRHAASIGLYETTDAAAGWPAIESLLGGRRIAAPVATEPPSRGTAIAVWGPSGAPGRTTFAIGIASELAALGHRVVLADVDTYGASVAPALGMLDESPGFAAACRLAGGDSLNAEELDRISQRYEGASTFRVLTGIGRASRWPELSSDRVAAVIKQCREWAEFTVLDTASSLESDEEISSDVFAPRRNAATVTALREADRVIAVGAADPVGMSRFLRSHVDLVDACGSSTIDVVMNRVRASAIGAGPGSQVTKTLARFGGIESPVLVPYDQGALDGAVLSGRTLLDVAPRSAVRRAIADLVGLRIAPNPSRSRARRRAR